ncbi:hypothetical protein MHB42_00215 [Lysinibacillus sp. FSL K6-0232]|uniref:hypothetical protein n=1 Tax=unclassified Lysinibacillus TaxID=2636778 RepID=UPI0030F76DE9
MTSNIENEIGFILPDANFFSEICDWKGEEFGGWISPFVVQRSSVFLDTKNFKLYRNNKVLSLVTNASLKEPNMNKVMFKIGKYEDNFRKEFNVFFKRGKDIDGYLNEIFLLAGEENLTKNLISQLVMKQKRYKRYFIEDNTKIFISIDSISYFRPEDLNNIIGTIYICEIETAEISVSVFVEEKIKELINIIKTKYRGISSNKSKYEHGLAFLSALEEAK